MSKVKHVLTVDIGTFTIKVAEFACLPNKITLEYCECVEYRDDLGNEDKINLVKTAFEKILNKYKFKAKDAYISISNSFVFTRFVKLPPTQNKQQKLLQIVSYEAKQNIPYPIDEVTWDYQLIGGNVPGSDGLNAMFVVVKNDLIDSIIDIFESNKFDVKSVDVSSTALYNCMRALKSVREIPSLLINIGFQVTTIVFSESGNTFSRTIPIGGYTITQQISKELSLTPEQSENLKRKLGSVSLGTNYGEGDSEVENNISKIIRNVFIRLHGEIIRSIGVNKSRHGGSDIQKIYLAGGSSLIKYVPNFFSDRFKLPVEYLNPYEIADISQKLNLNEINQNVHLSSELVGAALRFAAKCPIEISLFPEKFKKKQQLKNKILFFYAIAAIIVISLGIVYWGLSSQLTLTDELISSNQFSVRSIEKDMKNIKDASKILGEKEAVYNQMTEMLKPRNAWFDVLNNLQVCLPDDTWIVKMTPVEKNIGNEAAGKTGRNLFWNKKPELSLTASQDAGKPVEYIEVTINTLVLHKNMKVTQAERFKENLLKNSIFSNDAKDISIVDYSPPATDKNNISRAQILIKLKNKI